MLKRAFGVMALMAITVSPVALMNKQAGATAPQAKSNQFWWPDQLNLNPLRDHDVSSNAYGADFDYAKEFASLDLEALKKDIENVLTTSQDWWPADYGNYGPLFIRMAWHSAGTYRTYDGRGGAGGGQIRFEPLASWPDNGNIDKARRLLWPVKQKYGRKISWADLMVLTGNVAMESMGFKTLGFAGGRADDWEADLVYWGPETEMLASNRHSGARKLNRPFGATQMGLIYVNPEGPNGNGDPLAAAKDIRAAFGRMAMNDAETVALIAGGHTFGKGHGAAKPDECVGVEPAAAAIEDQNFGWKNKCGKGNAEDTITSGLEGAWTASPAEWTHMYLTHLFSFDWKKKEIPSGATLWVPVDEENTQIVPDAHIKDEYHVPVMYTTDIALKEDPEYKKISQRFLENPEEFEDAFARAWFKLTHRDMGPKARYIGADVPEISLIWQDPLPEADYKTITQRDVKKLKKEILESGLSVSELVRTAWASASTYRDSDRRGGANGARIRLAPQKDWVANNPDELSEVLDKLEEVQKDFNKSLSGRKQVSLADVIVAGGAAAIEKAAKDAGYKDVEVPFVPGRVDAQAAQTDAAAFEELKPNADAFRNYYSEDSIASPTQMMIDKADLLGLNVPEMTVLVGGMRVLGANFDGSKHGVFTDKPGTLSTDYFVNLLSMETEWKKSDQGQGMYNGLDRATGQLKWTATPVDLIFGSHAELRAVAEVYAATDGKQKFLDDFIAAWTRVMTRDRFDLSESRS